ncbi:hypothetical protein LY78DRAFT_354028 [Colletotrichum sublineola]|nr:hypothetical protein LY78DRAFT_354028 [Colletotrichum sublineola]
MHKPFGTFPTYEARGPGVFRPYFFFFYLLFSFAFLLSPLERTRPASGVWRPASSNRARLSPRDVR